MQDLLGKIKQRFKAQKQNLLYRKKKLGEFKLKAAETLRFLFNISLWRLPPAAGKAPAV